MTASVRTALILSLLMACHGAGRGEPFGRVLERGGELAEVELADKTGSVTRSTVTVWGVLEVHDGARMQAAYAGADAIARSELLKLVRVRVADVMVSVDSTDPARRVASEHTVEVVGGVIRHAGSPRHGWERVLRGEQVIVRVWARLQVPRAELESALQTAGSAAALELPADMRDELSSGEPSH